MYNYLSGYEVIDTYDSDSVTIHEATIHCNALKIIMQVVTKDACIYGLHGYSVYFRAVRG